MPLAEWAHGENALAPWSQFAEVRRRVEARDLAAAKALLQEIIATPDLESRHYLQAWNELRGLGIQPAAEAKQLLGVVVEVGLSEGLDLLAAYADRSARYCNFSGAAVIWERPDASLDGEIDRLFQTAEVILEQIGPWDGARPPAPPRDHARINMLTPAGIFFGQAPLRTLATDPLAGPAIAAATNLMQALIEKAESTERR